MEGFLFQLAMIVVFLFFYFIFKKPEPPDSSITKTDTQPDIDLNKLNKIEKSKSPSNPVKSINLENNISVSPAALTTNYIPSKFIESISSYNSSKPKKIKCIRCKNEIYTISNCSNKIIKCFHCNRYFYFEITATGRSDAFRKWEINEIKFLVHLLMVEKLNYDQIALILARSVGSVKDRIRIVKRNKSNKVDISSNPLKVAKKKLASNRDTKIYLVSNTENERLLDKYKIYHLYHMTSINNLYSILKYGLFSHSGVREKSFKYRDISDNSVNDRREKIEPIYGRPIHSYVPLYFNPKNPMLFKRKELSDSIVILVLKRRLIYQSNCIFTDGNAASDDTKYYNQLNKLSEIDWDCIHNEYWSSFTDGKRKKCAEVLVYPYILSSEIIKIISINSTTVEKAHSIAKKNEIPVELNLNYYFNN